MRLIILSIIIFSFYLIKGQQGELIDFNTYKIYNRNCDLIPSCVDKASFADDTLEILFTTATLHYPIQPQLSYLIKNDTLEIKYLMPEIVKDTIIYNKDKNKYEKTKYYIGYATMKSAFDKSCTTFSLSFSKILTMPKYIVFNGTLMENCPTKNIEYKLYNEDTINIINRNGFQHGTWLEFYDSGQIMTKKIYRHGQFIWGYKYDRNGQVIDKLFPRLN